MKVAVIVLAAQRDITYCKSVHTRIAYFSRQNRVVNIDNLIPFDEIASEDSIYLLRKRRDMIQVRVVILPFPQAITQEAPEYSFK
jgi:hypothetical protein